MKLWAIYAEKMCQSQWRQEQILPNFPTFFTEKRAAIKSRLRLKYSSFKTQAIELVPQLDRIRLIAENVINCERVRRRRNGSLVKY